MPHDGDGPIGGGFRRKNPSTASTAVAEPQTEPPAKRGKPATPAASKAGKPVKKGPKAAPASKKAKGQAPPANLPEKQSTDNKAKAKPDTEDATPATTTTQTGKKGAKAGSDAAAAAGRKLYIVFIGNLSYDTTAEEVTQHFKSCGPCVVRLLKKKGTDQPRGCAFAEFETASGHEKALSYHLSKLKGRKINVEPTAGGGGKSEKRKAKIQKLKSKVQKRPAGAGAGPKGPRNNAKRPTAASS